MQLIRKTMMLGLVIGGAYVALSPKRRAAAAEKLKAVRRFLSEKLADRDARVDKQASNRWEGEGGRIPTPGAQLH